MNKYVLYKYMHTINTMYTGFLFSMIGLPKKEILCNSFYGIDCIYSLNAKFSLHFDGF